MKLYKIKKLIRRNILKPAWLYLLIKPTKPLSDWHGFDRGTPIDRYYIENFLEKEKEKIQGVCLEFLNKYYIDKYGQNVLKADILDINKENKEATIISDLRNLKNVQDNTFDCIIMTQVLHFIDDIDAAISETHRVLKPNGSVLITVPFLNRMDKNSGPEEDFWRFTKVSLDYVLSKHFSKDKIKVETKGNVYSGLMSHIGACLEEVSKKKMQVEDENFPLIISAVATK